MTAHLHIFARRLDVPQDVIGQEIVIYAPNTQSAKALLDLHLRQIAEDEGAEPWASTGQNVSQFTHSEIALDQPRVLMSRATYLRLSSS